MNWWFALALYVVGYILTFRRIAGQLAWHLASDRYRYVDDPRPSAEQWSGAIATAFFGSIIWPISLPVAYGISSSRRGTAFFYIPAKAKDDIYRARIAELEKKTGVA